MTIWQHQMMLVEHHQRQFAWIDVVNVEIALVQLELSLRRPMQTQRLPDTVHVASHLGHDVEFTPTDDQF